MFPWASGLGLTCMFWLGDAALEATAIGLVRAGREWEARGVLSVALTGLACFLLMTGSMDHLFVLTEAGLCADAIIVVAVILAGNDSLFSFRDLGIGLSPHEYKREASD